MYREDTVSQEQLLGPQKVSFSYDYHKKKLSNASA